MNKNQNIFHLFLLIFTAFIWGNAFVAQSVGADYVGPFTFLAIRTWMALVLLIPFMWAQYKKVHLDKQEKKTLIMGGFLCGTFLFLGSVFQQIGIAYTTTAKAGFITTLYMIIVPFVSIFSGKKPSLQIWIAVILGMIGLYMLTMQGALSINIGDIWMVACACAFAGQILCVHKVAPRVNPILLSGVQFLACALYASVGFLFEPFQMSDIQMALPTLLYAGIFSSGIGYTFQIIGQRGLNPTVASIAMCMESVFSALAGWFWLHQGLTTSELIGCALMFVAILITQIPEKKQDTSPA